MGDEELRKVDSKMLSEIMKRFLCIMLLMLAACAQPGAALQSTPAETAPTPTVRVAIQTTDPSTVVLAAGKPQLIEFLTFW